MRAFASTSAVAALPLRVARCRGTARIASVSARSRDLHTLPPYPFPVENGLANFLSPKALKTIAVEYQGGLLDRLNDQVKDTKFESMTVVQTVLETARDPNEILSFNLASQALNNSFFLDNLAPTKDDAPNHENSLPAGLSNAITTEWSSLSQLKSNVSAAALGMMSSGWIWLVIDSSGRLGILPTYGAGTALARSRTQTLPKWLEPSVDRLSGAAASANGSSSILSNPGKHTLKAKGRQSASPPLRPNSNSPPSHPLDQSGQVRHFGVMPHLRSLGDTSAKLFDESGDVYQPSSSKGKEGVSFPRSDGPLHGYGDKLTPLFCLSVHEHAWLHDYGVWGKEEYLKNFWNVLDWGRVGHLHYELTRTQNDKF